MHALKMIGTEITTDRAGSGGWRLGGATAPEQYSRLADRGRQDFFVTLEPRGSEACSVVKDSDLGHGLLHWWRRSQPHVPQHQDAVQFRAASDRR